MLYRFLDNADIFFEHLHSRIADIVLSNFNKLIIKLGWYIEHLGIMSLLVAFLILLSIINIILHLHSHKKMMSKAFWRGYKNGEKDKEDL